MLAHWFFFYLICRVRLSAFKILDSFLMQMMQPRQWTPAMTILLLDKESVIPTLLVSPNQHINLITSLHLRQRWGIWGHDSAFGTTRFWWDLHACCLKSMLVHSWWGSLSLSPHKGMSHKENAWICESIAKKQKQKKHCRHCLFVYMEKGFSLRCKLTTDTKKNEYSSVAKWK